MLPRRPPARRRSVLDVSLLHFCSHSLLLTWDGIHLGAVALASMTTTAILRLGHPDRHPVLVPPSEAVNDRPTEAGEILLHRGHPRFELAATLLAPMHWGLGVDDLADDFVGRTSRSVPEPTKSMLKKHRRQGCKSELSAKVGARTTFYTTAT